MPTKIPWCDATWSPVTGCTPIGTGCQNCYAKRQALRLKAMGLPKYRNGFKVTCHPDELDAKVLRKRKPRLIFVCSMGDLFHEKVPTGFIDQVLAITYNFPQHTYIVLTKRPARMQNHLLQILESRSMIGCPHNVPGDNLWLGVSVSTQAEADKWIPILLDCPAARWVVSYEPALARVDFSKYCVPHTRRCEHPRHGIDWLICGCESGPKRRPFDMDWARGARDVCQKTGIPFFLKQARDCFNKVVHRPCVDGRRWEEYPNDDS